MLRLRDSTFSDFVYVFQTHFSKKRKIRELKRWQNLTTMAEEIYGNDERIETLWAIKAMEHAEVYFNVSITAKSFVVWP